MTENSFDVPRAQRWFAVEFNNRAWDLVEQAERTDAETEEMIHAAHAALVHWQAAGTALNSLRAYCLLATAYIAAQRIDSAARYAKICLDHLPQVEGATPLDRACTYGCAAAAYAQAGDQKLAREFHERAAVIAESLTTEARGVVEKLYPVAK